jgi:predicted amidophosphoribosyltransferase
MPKLLKIDDSNRDAHYYLGAEDRCFYFHEYTSHKGYAHSKGNSFISNLKKPVAQCNEPHYRFKTRAIQDGAAMLRVALERSPNIFNSATFVPIPPSKPHDHPDHDDRIMQIVQGACDGKGADVRNLLVQTQAYEASHLQGPGGSRLGPDELQALYSLHADPPREIVMLVDDVLTTGAHFIAAKRTILHAYPQVKVAGIFMARRILPSPDTQAN